MLKRGVLVRAGSVVLIGLVAAAFPAHVEADSEFAAGGRDYSGVVVRAEKTSTATAQSRTGADEVGRQDRGRVTKGTTPARVSQGVNVLKPMPTTESPLAGSVRAGRTFIPECFNGFEEVAACQQPTIPAGPADPADPSRPAAPAPAPPTRAEVEAVVRSLVARMDLPESAPQIGPDPSANEWGMAVVGHPLWLWVPGDATMSSRVTGYGITITLDARRTSTTFAMGDGKSVTCARMTPYPAGVKPGTASSTCGYAYSWPSLPNGTYRVTASSSWVVDWTALGFSGAIPVTMTGARDLPVGELHALNVTR